jgi:hypothetical protein
LVRFDVRPFYPAGARCKTRRLIFLKCKDRAQEFLALTRLQRLYSLDKLAGADAVKDSLGAF